MGQRSSKNKIKKGQLDPIPDPSNQISDPNPIAPEPQNHHVPPPQKEHDITPTTPKPEKQPKKDILPESPRDKTTVSQSDKKSLHDTATRLEAVCRELLPNMSYDERKQRLSKTIETFFQTTNFALSYQTLVYEQHSARSNFINTILRCSAPPIVTTQMLYEIIQSFPALVPSPIPSHTLHNTFTIITKQCDDPVYTPKIIDLLLSRLTTVNLDSFYAVYVTLEDYMQQTVSYNAMQLAIVNSFLSWLYDGTKHPNIIVRVFQKSKSTSNKPIPTSKTKDKPVKAQDDNSTLIPYEGFEATIYHASLIGARQYFKVHVIPIFFLVGKQEHDTLQLREVMAHIVNRFGFDNFDPGVGLSQPRMHLLDVVSEDVEKDTQALVDHEVLENPTVEQLQRKKELDDARAKQKLVPSSTNNVLYSDDMVYPQHCIFSAPALQGQNNLKSQTQSRAVVTLEDCIFSTTLPYCLSGSALTYAFSNTHIFTLDLIVYLQHLATKDQVRGIMKGRYNFVELLQKRYPAQHQIYLAQLQIYNEQRASSNPSQAQLPPSPYEQLLQLDSQLRNESIQTYHSVASETKELFYKFGSSSGIPILSTLINNILNLDLNSQTSMGFPSNETNVSHLQKEKLGYAAFTEGLAKFLISMCNTYGDKTLLFDANSLRQNAGDFSQDLTQLRRGQISNAHNSSYAYEHRKNSELDELTALTENSALLNPMSGLSFIAKRRFQQHQQLLEKAHFAPLKQNITYKVLTHIFHHNPFPLLFLMRLVVWVMRTTPNVIENDVIQYILLYVGQLFPSTFSYKKPALQLLHRPSRSEIEGKIKKIEDERCEIEKQSKAQPSEIEVLPNSPEKPQKLTIFAQNQQLFSTSSDKHRLAMEKYIPKWPQLDDALLAYTVFDNSLPFYKEITLHINDLWHISEFYAYNDITNIQLLYHPFYLLLHYPNIFFQYNPTTSTTNPCHNTNLRQQLTMSQLLLALGQTSNSFYYYDTNQLISLMRCSNRDYLMGTLDDKSSLSAFKNPSLLLQSHINRNNIKYPTLLMSQVPVGGSGYLRHYIHTAHGYFYFPWSQLSTPFHTIRRMTDDFLSFLNSHPKTPVVSIDFNGKEVEIYPNEHNSPLDLLNNPFGHIYLQSPALYFSQLPTALPLNDFIKKTEDIFHISGKIVPGQDYLPPPFFNETQNLSQILYFLRHFLSVVQTHNTLAQNILLLAQLSGYILHLVRTIMGLISEHTSLFIQRQLSSVMYNLILFLTKSSLFKTSWIDDKDKKGGDDKDGDKDPSTPFSGKNGPNSHPSDVLPTSLYLSAETDEQTNTQIAGLAKTIKELVHLGTIRKVQGTNSYRPTVGPRSRGHDSIPSHQIETVYPSFFTTLPQEARKKCNVANKYGDMYDISAILASPGISPEPFHDNDYVSLDSTDIYNTITPKAEKLFPNAKKLSPLQIRSIYKTTTLPLITQVLTLLCSSGTIWTLLYPNIEDLITPKPTSDKKQTPSVTKHLDEMSDNGNPLAIYRRHIVPNPVSGSNNLNSVYAYLMMAIFQSLFLQVRIFEQQDEEIAKFLANKTPIMDKSTTDNCDKSVKQTQKQKVVHFNELHYLPQYEYTLESHDSLSNIITPIPSITSKMPEKSHKINYSTQIYSTLNTYLCAMSPLPPNTFASSIIAAFYRIADNFIVKLEDTVRNSFYPVKQHVTCAITPLEYLCAVLCYGPAVYNDDTLTEFFTDAGDVKVISPLVPDVTQQSDSTSDSDGDSWSGSASEDEEVTKRKLARKLKEIIEKQQQELAQSKQAKMQLFGQSVLLYYDLTAYNGVVSTENGDIYVPLPPINNIFLWLLHKAKAITKLQHKAAQIHYSLEEFLQHHFHTSIQQSLQLTPLREKYGLPVLPITAKLMYFIDATITTYSHYFSMHNLTHGISSSELGSWKPKQVEGKNAPYIPNLTHYPLTDPSLDNSQCQTHIVLTETTNTCSPSDVARSNDTEDDSNDNLVANTIKNMIGKVITHKNQYLYKNENNYYNPLGLFAFMLDAVYSPAVDDVYTVLSGVVKPFEKTVNLILETCNEKGYIDMLIEFGLIYDENELQQAANLRYARNQSISGSSREQVVNQPILQSDISTVLAKHLNVTILNPQNTSESEDEPEFTLLPLNVKEQLRSRTVTLPTRPHTFITTNNISSHETLAYNTIQHGVCTLHNGLEFSNTSSSSSSSDSNNNTANLIYKLTDSTTIDSIAGFMKESVVLPHYQRNSAPDQPTSTPISLNNFPQETLYTVNYGCELLITAILRRCDEVTLMALFNLIGAEDILAYRRPMFIQQIAQDNDIVYYNVFDFLNAAHTMEYAVNFVALVYSKQFL